MPYQIAVTDSQHRRLVELAGLVRTGRDLFKDGSQPGFTVRPGSSSAVIAQLPLQSDWVPAPWQPEATTLFHEVGLRYALVAHGFLGEMGGLLETNEVYYSVPLLARGVLEQVTYLFQMYVKPHRDNAGVIDRASTCLGYAAAYAFVIESAYSAVSHADKTLALNPTDADLQAESSHASSMLDRLLKLYGPLFDPATTDLSKKKLKLGGFRPPTTTAVVDDIASWIWPTEQSRPAPLYGELSGLAHGTLSAQSGLFDIQDSNGVRQITRNVPMEHIDYLVAIASILFFKAFGSLTTFYGWDEAPAKSFAAEIQRVFPQFASSAP